MTNVWPKQSECDAFYGNPRGPYGSHVNDHWYMDNIHFVVPPFVMHMGGILIKKIAIHRKCAESLARVLAVPGIAGDAHNFSGSFCYRAMRGSSHLSMHAYGCAIDFNAEHNPFHSKIHQFQPGSPLVKAFESEGWVWGGRWEHPDAMHFQAARV